MNVTLSHATGPGGGAAGCWDYHDDRACPVARVPGSSSGAEVILLRTWQAALAALRSPLARNLAEVSPDYALAGITREHPAGLLRREDPALRAALHPLLSPAPWRPAITGLARGLAARLAAFPGPADLVTAYCEPLAAAVTCLVTGITPAQQRELAALSAAANALIREPADHERGAAARLELYAFCGPLARQAGSAGAAGLLAGSVRVMRGAGVPEADIPYACATILGGFPSLTPALSVAVTEIVSRPAVMSRLPGRPDLVRAAAREAVRHSACFTFALPGRVMRDTDLGPFAVPAGAVVLPVIRAAQHDPAHVPGDPAAFSPGRPRAGLLAFGAGPHACPARALSLTVLEAAVAALADLDAQPRPAADPAAAAWVPGLMPVPAAIPVRTGGAP